MGGADLTVAEAAQYLGVSLRTFYKLVAAGELVPQRAGRSFRFDVDTLDAFLAAHRVQPGSLTHLVPPQQRGYRSE